MADVVVTGRLPRLNGEDRRPPARLETRCGAPRGCGSGATCLPCTPPVGPRTRRHGRASTARSDGPSLWWSPRSALTTLSTPRPQSGKRRPLASAAAPRRGPRFPCQTSTPSGATLAAFEAGLNRRLLWASRGHSCTGYLTPSLRPTPTTPTPTGPYCSAISMPPARAWVRLCLDIVVHETAPVLDYRSLEREEIP